MRLFPYDAYASLTRVFDPSTPLRVIDVGANEGQTIERIRSQFSNAQVFAFEPAPETFTRLQQRVGHWPRVGLFPYACGSSCGSVEFHVTDNHWCSSVLPPSELGKRFYGDWYNTRQVVRVPLITLDAWAQHHQAYPIDVLKIDAQGYDLEVLRGAVGLLRAGIKAINCECQFAPEYQGCASFSQIDLFLAHHGFALHQLHEVHSRGDEEQTTYGDGLWLRVDVLEQLRQRKDLPDLSPIGRLTRTLRQALASGATTIALYGAGRHTQALSDRLHTLPAPIAAIIDDNPKSHGSRLGGVEVISQSAALARGIDTVVLSSDAHEPALWDQAAPLRERGVRVLALYDQSLRVALPTARGTSRTLAPLPAASPPAGPLVAGRVPAP